MGPLMKLFLFGGFLTAALLAYLLPCNYPIPVLEDGWWAEGDLKSVDESVRPFTINVSQQVLDDLNERLDRVNRLVLPLETIGFQYGFNSNFMKSVIKFWREDYIWKEQEAYLNTFPHFKTNIEGLNIHFIHVVPEKTSLQVIPLLMLHGWPGSFVEFLKIVPLLAREMEDCDFVYEIIIPSLPGYGFSDPSRKPGLGPVEMGQIFNKLMNRLGHQKYYVQGGDWGSLIGTSMATLYPHKVQALHLNMMGSMPALSNVGLLLGSLWPSLLLPADKVHLVYPLKEKFGILLRETGYMHLQATKPDTVGIALSDSPVGLAAYILEKFSTWTVKADIVKEDGGLNDSFTMSELLNNVMIYWVTNSITSSMRLYSEAFTAKTMNYKIDEIPCIVPTALAIFPEELFIQSEPLAKLKFTHIVSFNFMETGGHFAAFQEPHLLEQDVRQFTRSVRKLAAPAGEPVS